MSLEEMTELELSELSGACADNPLLRRVAFEIAKELRFRKANEGSEEYPKLERLRKAIAKTNEASRLMRRALK